MTNSTLETKTCTKCGEILSATLEFFYKHERGLYGLRSWCKKCHNKITSDTSKQWQKDHPERIREIQHKHYHANKGRINKRRREKINREKARINTRHWYWTNREKRIRYNHQYREANRGHIAEYHRQWREDNSGKVRAIQLRRRARKRGLLDTFTGEQWLQCLDYHNYCCPACGVQLRDLFGNVKPHADHWIPMSYDGDDNPGTVATNMICLCNKCNMSKHDIMPDVWLKQKFGTRKAAQILARIEAYFATLDS